MPRAERSQDTGELFRQKVADLLLPLRYDILGEKYAIKCRSEFHRVSEHTIDILARHLHSGVRSHKKTILIESKKALPSAGGINDIVVDLANKIDCVCKKNMYSETNEGVVFTDENVSLNQEESFNKAAERISNSRDYTIGLIGGSKFRLFEALSSIAKQYSASQSISIINCSKKPDQDLGAICPLSMEENSRLYLCAMKAGEIRFSVFKIDGENYASENFLEDMQWIRKYSAICDQIHSTGGFTGEAIRDIKATGLGIGIVDHCLLRSFDIQYLNYTMPH